ncbi:hypothetical protein NDU88_009411 [Pleurodeles waltl]|uniref:Uncharacterized protein n=1 Tax=Pleurodeles waltl TaxID=8319 RepID=A0AAV7S0X9_PLEWA|nr:hypothetical protein NDU88_009411 [Pleurodeles waltl]
MPRILYACSTDRCGHFMAFWRPPLGSGPRWQAPEGPARRCERGAHPRSALLFLLTEHDPRHFLASLAGLWGVWDALMAPKLNRTPRSLRVRQNQDPGGTRKDKKLPAPGLKEHSNLQVKGGLHKTTDMEKDTRYSVPTMFTSMMRLKQRSTEKAACDSQSNVPGVNDEQVPVASTFLEVLTPICNTGGREPPSREIDSTSPGKSGEVVAPLPMGCEKSSEQELKDSNQGPQESNPEKCEVQPCTLSCKLNSQQAEGMAKSSTTYETILPAPVQRGKEAKPANTDQGPFDTAESFFFLSDQSRDSDLDEETPLTDSDIESSSTASIWVSNYSTCRRKSVEQTDVRSSSGVKLRRDPLKPQEEDGEMQWDYTATQQAFLKSDSACSTLVPPSMGGPAEPPSLDLIYRTMVQNHEQAQRESRKMKAANRQLQLSIKKVGKSCQDIGVCIATMETRTEELEIEVKAATAQTTTQGQQISDIQWKLEDVENRQWRSILRILDIAEDLEGQDTRAYIALLFKKAFPDLIGMTQGWHIDKIKLMEVSRHPTSCGIKNLYPLLLNAILDDQALLVKKWEGWVGAKEIEVCESMEMARTVLLSASPQAQHFMVLYNLYYTPAKIASWGKTVGIMCPRCGCPNADLCHMFFQCVKLESLITGITDILKKILKQTIYLTPQMVLLEVDQAVCNS